MGGLFKSYYGIKAIPQINKFFLSLYSKSCRNESGHYHKRTK